jgi:hypothetical protein
LPRQEGADSLRTLRDRPDRARARLPRREEGQQLLARYFRGPITLGHPYLPDDTPVVLYGLTGQNVVDKVLLYWDEYVTKVN